LGLRVWLVGDLGDVEVQVQFANQPDPQTQDFAFRAFPVTAGKVTEVPIQLTAVARFRPKASFNPYLGVGVGYTLVGFSSSNSLDQLSANMDASRGGFAVLQGGAAAGGESFGAVQGEEDLSGARVSARDTFEWHAAGGLEYSFRSKWALFLDFRYVFAARALSIGFNDGTSLGISVPGTIAKLGEPVASARFGAVAITQGGLVDGGHMECPTSTTCVWSEVPDGVPDTGTYYVKGGSIRYGGASLQIGVRYTF
jgi:hypothetical protein